jgi:hypothetical protein
MPISSTLALTHLSAYLADATKNPYLLPNATLQPNGPVAQGNADSNLTIQHLRRVEAGLRGEWLAPVLDLGEESDPFADTTAAGSGKHKKFDEGNGDADIATEGWQDLSEYQREQSIEVGEAEPRELVVDGGRDAEDIMPVEVKSSGKEGVDKAKDKEQRKKEKKEREKKEKREKAKKARLAATA